MVVGDFCSPDKRKDLNLVQSGAKLKTRRLVISVVWTNARVVTTQYVEVKIKTKTQDHQNGTKTALSDEP